MLSHIHGNSVNDLQFISDDGYRLLAASDDTTVVPGSVIPAADGAPLRTRPSRAAPKERPLMRCFRYRVRRDAVLVT